MKILINSVCLAKITLLVTFVVFSKSFLSFYFNRTTRLNKTIICCPTSTSTPTVSRPGSSMPGASNNAAATGY